ncbi:glycosyltransferase family 2 protein [Patescibacteria group bacterium]|nr:glycosyltransferase family 2 protein [Patescibacteria group bacterium]
MTRKRFFEMVPGALVWTTFVLSILLSYVWPLGMIYFIILFDLYWLLRIVYFIPFSLISWYRYRQALKRDWQLEAEQLPGYDEIRHLVFLPLSKEDPNIARDTIQHILEGSFPAERMIIVVACEARYPENARQVQEQLRPLFADKFQHFFVTVHPADLPGEVKGKGSNLHWASHEVVPQLLAEGLDPDKVIVSSFDVDTIAHPQYFSCLTQTYLTVEDPTRSSYQPVALYNNNLWESPAAVRVAMFGTTFWLLTELARPEGMMTFSSHSMSLRMLIDVGYWEKDIVSEDSRIFLQALIRYDGAYRVTPIHLPVSMDTVMAGDYWQALVALYKQYRRWAWGAENFPYMIEQFRTRPKMPWWEKAWWIFKQLEGMYTWASAPFLIFILGYLPFWLAPEAFHTFTIFQNTPFTLQLLMRCSMIGLFTSATLALTLLPPPPQSLSKPYAYFLIIIQWALLPVTFILFGALPAIDAQTRLMLGKTLGFNVSPKRTLPSPPTP